MDPRALRRLVAEVGLEDAGEIVAFATTDQLTQIFDEDLWRSRAPGVDDAFDASRFRLWIHVLLEAGDAFAAERVTELSEDLVTLAIHESVLVLHVDDLARRVLAGAEDLEKALEDCLSEELDEHLLIARSHDGWDDVLTLLLALDRDHHAYLVRLLDRCAALASDVIEDGEGLYDVLGGGEMLASDVADERDTRRAEAGFVAPSDAAAFLKLARGAMADASPSYREHDAITKAHLQRSSGTARRPLVKGEVALGAHAAAMLPRASSKRSSLLVTAMQRLADEDPPTFAARSEELAYLANVLVAGLPHEGRRMRPVEAVRAALAACERGLTLAMQADGLAAHAALQDYPADGLFRWGWAADGVP